ncbi:MAG: TetR family transcriptional regulator [Solirubrobacteraceae bacterium]|nr:TetR family transcriptional regulator [Solirubrobacteraceae bacterium]
MPHPVGLRERKKRQTRDAIIEAALHLFDEQGFEATTIAQIAQAVDIAPRTFFGYFKSKEQVVFYDSDAMRESFARRLAARASGETTMAALRAWIVGRADLMERPNEEAVLRERVLQASPTLLAHQNEVLARFEELLAQGIAQDLDDVPDGLRPRLVSAAAVAALRSMKRDQTDGTMDPDENVAILDEAIAFLDGGLRALQRAGATGGSPG